MASKELADNIVTAWPSDCCRFVPVVSPWRCPCVAVSPWRCPSVLVAAVSPCPGVFTPAAAAATAATAVRARRRKPAGHRGDVSRLASLAVARHTNITQDRSDLVGQQRGRPRGEPAGPWSAVSPQPAAPPAGAPVPARALVRDSFVPEHESTRDAAADLLPARLGAQRPGPVGPRPLSRRGLGRGQCLARDSSCGRWCSWHQRPAVRARPDSGADSGDFVCLWLDGSWVLVWPWLGSLGPPVVSRCETDSEEGPEDRGHRTASLPRLGEASGGRGSFVWCPLCAPRPSPPTVSPGCPRDSPQPERSTFDVPSPAAHHPAPQPAWWLPRCLLCRCRAPWRCSGRCPPPSPASPFLATPRRLGGSPSVSLVVAALGVLADGVALLLGEQPCRPCCGVSLARPPREWASRDRPPRAWDALGAPVARSLLFAGELSLTPARLRLLTNVL
jgi:hypothetical protein